MTINGGAVLQFHMLMCAQKADVSIAAYCKINTVSVCILFIA